jgi:hypothetical protein
MLKSTTTSFILFLVLLFAASQALAGIAVLERLRTESIIFKATGEGVYPDDSSMGLAQKKLMARRAATVDAYRKLLEKVNEIEVNSESKLEDLLIKHDEVTVKVSGFIRGAQIVDVRTERDGIVEVDVMMELGKDFYDIVKPYIR